MLFPIHCLSCGKDGVWFCDECLMKIQPIDFQVCPICEKIISESGKICSNCQSKRPDLDVLLVSAKYENISKIVHLFKYNFIQDLSEPLGKILVKNFLNSKLPLPDFLIPIPLHKRRLRWRGFNQSGLLASYLSQNLTPNFEIPVLEKALFRKKYTFPQMKLKNFKARRENIKNAFSVKDINALKNKTILLVDDVSTTGSTIFECAKILKANGAKKVFGIVIARQEYVGS